MTFEQMFKGLQGKIVSKKRKEKENRRKSNNGKRKPFKNPMCISYLGPKSPRQRASPLLYFPPFLTIPEAYACINVEDIATILFRQVAPLFCCSSFTNIYIFLLVMQQEVGCSPILSQTLGTRCTASCILMIIKQRTPVKRKKKTMKRGKRTMKMKTRASKTTLD